VRPGVERHRLGACIVKLSYGQFPLRADVAIIVIHYFSKVELMHCFTVFLRAGLADIAPYGISFFFSRR
jgi:hypothetical protein